MPKSKIHSAQRLFNFFQCNLKAIEIRSRFAKGNTLVTTILGKNIFNKKL